MKIFHKLMSRFRQFGGIKLVWAYLQEGILLVVIHQAFCLSIGRKSRDESYAAIRRKINEKLQRKYATCINERKNFYEKQELRQQRSRTIWVCWLQGLENAPIIVKACYNSLQRYFVQECKGSKVQGYEIKVVDAENWRKYVKLPKFIIKKWDEGKIPAALFSDLLRLELLIKYGGTWMDSTVLCTGFQGSKVQEYKSFLDVDLFMFQTLVKGDDRFYGTSNWFITACSGNKLLMVLRDVLLQYWKDYNVTLNYYMFHDFFYTIAQLYPEEIAAMPRANRLLPLQLMRRMGDTYDEEWMERLKSICCFHKLNYRLSADVEKDTENFYHAIIKDYT